MRLSRAYDLFIQEQRISQHTEATLEFYKYSAGKFVDYCEDVDCNSLQALIPDYFDHLRDRVKPVSVHTYWRGIRTFCRWLNAEGYTETAIRLPTIRCPETAIRPLPAPKISQLLRHLKPDSFTGLRNQAILRLFYDTGIRLKELYRLDMGHLELEEGLALVQGKGKKERWVPIGKKTRRLLWRYIKQRAKYSGAEQALFLTQSGERLSYYGIRTMFRRLADDLGMRGVRISAHTLRHSFAIDFLDGGGTERALQVILGHSTRRMTDKYGQAALGFIKRQHERHSPGDRI